MYPLALHAWSHCKSLAVMKIIGFRYTSGHTWESVYCTPTPRATLPTFSMAAPNRDHRLGPLLRDPVSPLPVTLVVVSCCQGFGSKCLVQATLPPSNRTLRASCREMSHVSV